MALPAMWMMWKGLQTSRENIGKNFYKVVILMTITVVFMGSGRQIYRANALEPHQKLVKLRTEEFEQTRKIAIEKEVKEIKHQNGTISTLIFEDGSEENFNAAYAAIPFEQNCKISLDLGCELTENGLIKTDIYQKTNVFGIYACGDNSSPMRSVANAVATGNLVGAMVNNELTIEQF